MDSLLEGEHQNRFDLSWTDVTFRIQASFSKLRSGVRRVPVPIASAQLWLRLETKLITRKIFDILIIFYDFPSFPKSDLFEINDH